MSLAVALVGRTVCLESTLTHDGLADDEGRLTLNRFCSVDSLADSSHIVSVDFEYFPTECTILGSSVLVHHDSSFCRELDVVGVVEHDDVVESEVCSYTTCALRDFLFDTAIRDVDIDGFLCKARIASVGSEELSSDGCTDAVRMALSERT